MIKYISNKAHYETVLKACYQAKQTLWIGTADIKDLHVSYRGSFTPFLQVISDLLKKGVEVRLIHAKEPGPNFRRDFDKFPAVIQGLERMLCPRVHFKLIIIDMQKVYIGSANLTGAAMGAKSDDKRNFEAGIFTELPEMLDSAIHQFDEVWMGKHCKTCSRKAYCGDKVV
ncbi:MAG: phospholipase D-like domain-containing protein [Bacteroidales bacterium]|jgi:phosphatidylserine/phosphatidylglycerophosphate/cardiolipin synthase-like enzyme|nr:phospholipase D-like domain-containing protein [Bacteroidales bacterium]